MRRILLLVVGLAGLAFACSPVPAFGAVPRWEQPYPGTTVLPAWQVPPRGLHPCGNPTTAEAPSDIRFSIYGAAAEHGVSPQLLLAIARGESGYDRRSSNSAGAQGLYQHLRRYWSERVRAFNKTHSRDLRSGSVFDVDDSSRVTAWMLAGGMGGVGRRAWNC